MKGLSDQEIVNRLTARRAGVNRRRDNPFHWPPRPIRRAMAVGERNPRSRRGRKATARIIRLAARYGVKVTVR